MTDLLEDNAIERWRANPASFIEEVLRTYDVDSGKYKPFKLFDAQRLFLKYAWQPRGDGRLLYPDQYFSTIKKTGKTNLAAAHVLTTTLILGGRNAEGYCIANDLEQAQGRVFDAICKICQNSPLLARECVITQSRITFPQTGAVIQAIASDDAGAAGAQPVISSFDEMWGFSTTRLRRLWEEMISVPTRKISCRLVTTHAGYSGESELLEEIYADGLKLPEIANGLRAGNGTLFFWSHDRLAPWQTEQWLVDMRHQQKRPLQFIRQFENRFVSSENPFIGLDAWDRCVDDELSPVVRDRNQPVFVGLDAGHKHDSTGIVATSWDEEAQKVRLVRHKIFVPSKDAELDFESTIEATLIDWAERFDVVEVRFDPWQMAAVAQRLTRQGLKITEYAQSLPNLTRASQNLFELIQGKNLQLYPDAAMRLAVSRAVAIETPRGWKISKEKASHRIDIIVALGMSALAAVEQGSKGQGLCHDYARHPERARAIIAESNARPYDRSGIPNHLREGYWEGQLGERSFAQLRRRRGY